MAIQKNKRSSTAAPAGKLIKKVKRDEPTELHADPMIDPTDSSGSELDDEEDEEESDAGDDDLEEFEGDDAGEVEDEGIPASSPHKNGTTEPSAEAGPSRRPAQSHVKGKSLYAPATAEELERLRSAQETGNTFTLQLEDLVARTLLPITPHPGTKDLLSRLHDLILGMPPLEAVSPKEALKRTPDLPFVGGKEWSPLKGAVQWTLGWEKPAEVFVGGSWTAAGGYKKGKGVAGDVDLVVVMPSSMFSAKDRMDHRYFHKRVHYLAVIKGAIVKAFKKDAGLRDVEAEWAYSMGDARRPIVLLKAGKAQGLKYATEIKIHASLPSDVFSASHLSPIKSLCRINAGETQPSAEPASSHPTPLYASSIAHDTLHKAHLLNIHRLSTSLADRNVASFVALWRIWAAQRSLPPSRGGSAWFAGMLLGWIVDGGRIGGQGGVRERTKEVKGLGKGLGYWGSLRAVWEFLARTDFTATPIFVGGQEGAIPPMHFCAAFDNVLVDPTGTVNVLAGWEEGEVQLLKHHARETLAMLEDHSVDRFDELFAKPTKAQIGVYDEMIITDISSAQLIETPLDIAEQPSRSTRIATSIAQTLRQGLSDRARIVHVSVLDPARVQIGIIFDPTQANRVLDVGPSSDKAAEGEMFRKLWGEKADLRRFKDGTIAESVVWPISRPEDAALIPLNIVTWLLQRHFSISAADISARFSGEEWLSVVQIPASAREATCVAGAEKLGFSPIMKAYDELYRLLKSIDDQLPLAILNVVPADEALRYSSTFIPHPMDEARSALAPDCLRYVSSAEVILQFESSPRWPDDLSAIQKVKLAIFEKLARVITDSLKGSRAEIVFDSLAAAASDIEDQAGLEVLMANGVAFRLRIHHEKERTHLERIIEGDAPVSGLALPLPPRKQAIPALAHYTTRFLHRPAHHSAITPLHSRFPSYSSATRLLKRWIASHMLSLHIPSEAVELIMASVYLESGSTSPPTSAGAGFARAVQRLATWSFDTEPLFVPLVSATHDASFAKGATEEEILQSQSGRTRFPSALRKEGDELFAQRHQAVQHGKVGKAHAVAEGKGAWTIITEQDTTGRRWTSTMPSRVIAGRVRQLAGASLELFTSGEALLSVKSLFKTPLSNYSLLIHLRSSLLPRYAQALEPTAAEWESRTRTQLRNLSTSSGIYGTDVRIGFDPAGTFARDLQRLYGDSLLIFHDDLGGSVIGMLFNPSFDQPRAFKPILGYNSMPVKTGSELVEVNRDAVVGEIARLGEGLIERIERVGV